MDGPAFARVRSLVGKSQRDIAAMLGVSLKAVESYEQGWRAVPANVERILYFILFKLREEDIFAEPDCWVTRSCPEQTRSACLAWIAKEGRYCWFFTGRLCAAARGDSAAGKGGASEFCYDCAVFTRLLRRAEGSGAKGGNACR
jgi:transcriptional regulator with XRE-family HTH domain